METIAAIKEKDVGTISSIEDKEYLMALLKILESGPTDKIKLSDAERRQIDLGMDDYRIGSVVSQEEVEKDDEEWLSAK